VLHATHVCEYRVDVTKTYGEAKVLSCLAYDDNEHHKSRPYVHEQVWIRLRNSAMQSIKHVALSLNNSPWSDSFA